MLPKVNQTEEECNDRFSPMPVEILTHIFSFLPSLYDVLALAAVCRRLQQIWTTNFIAIYRQVGLRSITCERYARTLLDDQSETPLSKRELSVKDIHRLMRNSRMIEEAILKLEARVVCRVKCGPVSPEEFYGVDARRHPLTMTRTERLRFIKALYQLWDMMILDPAEWQSRLDPMKLRQCYYLREMTRVPTYIGAEDTVLHTCPNAEISLKNAIAGPHQSYKRMALEETIWEHIQRPYRSIHNRDGDDPWNYVKYEGFMWFVCIWDHWRDLMKQLGREDSSDEDI